MRKDKARKAEDELLELLKEYQTRYERYYPDVVVGATDSAKSTAVQNEAAPAPAPGQYSQTNTQVAGVDEAGMAPLAGPVVAGACILPHDYRPRGIDDSKQLDRCARERLAADIKANAVAWATARGEVEEIDRLNIYQAGLLALTRAVQGLSQAPQHVLVDARKLPALGIPHTPIIHGDALSLTIAAASILAKTTRDALMRELDAVHPGYGFSRHKGYPTAEHFEALARLGACPIHRRSFGPVKQALGLAPAQGDLFGGAADRPEGRRRN